MIEERLFDPTPYGSLFTVIGIINSIPTGGSSPKVHREFLGFSLVTPLCCVRQHLEIADPFINIFISCKWMNFKRRRTDQSISDGFIQTSRIETVSVEAFIKVHRHSLESDIEVTQNRINNQDDTTGKYESFLYALPHVGRKLSRVVR